MVSQSPARKKWNQVVRNNTVHVGKSEYVSIEGIHKLEKLFDKESRNLREHPGLVTEEIEKWLESTKGIIESLIIVAEVMDESARGIRAKTIAELESELYTCPRP